MRILKNIALFLAAFILVAGIAAWWLLRGDTADVPFEQTTGIDPTLDEPDPEMVPTIQSADAVGWADGAAPQAAPGLAVNRFADGLDHPRVMYTMPNGDVLVALAKGPSAPDMGSWIASKVAGLLFSRVGAGGPSPNQLVLLRDGDGDGVAEQRYVLRDDLDSPSGIAWRDGKLYVTNHDALLRFAYDEGATTVAGQPEKLMDLPPAGNHWMRNITLDPDEDLLYVAVGSASNIGEGGMDKEQGRAAIYEYDLADGRSRMYASGVRNANGLDWNPWSGELWMTVNERDMLGSDLVPDYLTNVPLGAVYGWPWVYDKDVIDERVEAPMPQFYTEYTRRPEYALGPHVAALGLAFTQGGTRMGAPFAQGAFIAEHGSWNRKPPSGYTVVFVPFDERGNPRDEPPVPVLGGFLEDGKAHGRPTWVAWDMTGALLVSDDVGGVIWRVVNPQAGGAAAPVRNRGASLPPPESLTGDPTRPFGDEQAQ